MSKIVTRESWNPLRLNIHRIHLHCMHFFYPITRLKVIALINYRVIWLILPIWLLGKHEYSIRPLVQSLCILMIFEGYCRSSLWITLWERGRCRTQANLLKKLPTCLITALDYARHAPTGVCSTRSNEEERKTVWDPPYGCLRGTVMEWNEQICTAVRTMCHERPAYGAKMKREPNSPVQGGLWYRWSYHTGV